MSCYPPRPVGPLRKKGTFNDHRKCTSKNNFTPFNEFGESYVARGFPVTHYHAKGNDVQAKKETLVFSGQSFGNSRRHYGAIDAAKRYVRKLVGHVAYSKCTMVPEVFRDPRIKDLDTGPGEPFCVLGGTYEDVLATMDEKFERMCADQEIAKHDTVEFTTAAGDYEVPFSGGHTLLYIAYVTFRDGIMFGETPVITFLVHSKEDKYKASKILTDNFRTIQGTDLFFFFLMKEFLDHFKNLLYDDKDHWIVACTPFEKMKLFEKLRTKFTTGIDYTAFDRYQSPQIVVELFTELVSHGLPPAIGSFIAQTVCYGPLSYHGGTYAPRQGGNPSGQYWTTLTNCFAHTVYIAYAYTSEDGVTDETFFERQWLVHGDDEICGFDTCDEATAYNDVMVGVQEEIGQIIKPESVIIDGELGYVFPPGFTAPFLGCGTQYINHSTNYPIPVHPTRRIPYVLHKPLASKTFDDTVVGVYNSLVALDVYHNYTGVGAPHPLLSFLKEVAEVRGIACALDSPHKFMVINTTSCSDHDIVRNERLEQLLLWGLF